MATARFRVHAVGSDRVIGFTHDSERLHYEDESRHRLIDRYMSMTFQCSL